MTRAVLMGHLKQRNITFSRTAKRDELQKLFDLSEEKIKDAIDDVQGVNKMTAEEIVEGGTRTEDGVQRPSGVLIPNQIISQMKKTQFKYVADCTTEACIVIKIDHRGKEEEVRTYSKDRHGEGFRDLAIMFVDKNNLKQR